MARRPKPGEPPPAGDLEARVTTLTPRGEIYQWQGKEFPPDQWVDITAEEAQMLTWLSAFSVRLKESG